jgi:hypothetical protein
MQNQLHTSAVVKKSFENQVVLGRHYAENDFRAREIFDDLIGGRTRYPNFIS